MQVVVDGETYRLQGSQVAYDLEVVSEPGDTVVGYIARRTADSAGFVPAAAANQVPPEEHADLADGIRALVNA